MSFGSLVLRLFIAVLLSAFSLSVLYLVPGLLMDLLSTIEVGPFRSILTQLIEPGFPSVGIVVSVLVFSVMMLRRTKLEGPLLIGLGVALFAYWYIAFSGGTMVLSIPETSVENLMSSGIPVEIEAHATINLTSIMLSLMITPILVTGKGILLSFIRFSKATN